MKLSYLVKDCALSQIFQGKRGLSQAIHNTGSAEPIIKCFKRGLKQTPKCFVHCAHWCALVIKHT